MRLAIATLLLTTSLSYADPEGLDRAAISTGIAQVKAKVSACGDTAKVGGKVKVKVTVAPDGKVSDAIPDAPDKDLGTCVATAVRTATFAKTKTGGSFSYPFVFPAKAATTPPAQGATPSKPAPSPAPGGPPPPTQGPPATPAGDALDRTAISEGVARIKAKIIACGDKSKAKGKLKLATTVAPSGKVTKVEVQATPDPALGACAANAMQSATFKKTAQGGSFSYPFIF